MQVTCSFIISISEQFLCNSENFHATIRFLFFSYGTCPPFFISIIDFYANDVGHIFYRLNKMSHTATPCDVRDHMIGRKQLGRFHIGKTKSSSLCRECFYCQDTPFLVNRRKRCTFKHTHTNTRPRIAVNCTCYNTM